MPTAVLVDGGFFIRRYWKLFPDEASRQPGEVAARLFTWALKHLEAEERNRRELQRIFFYDCAPLSKKAHNPVTGKAIDFSKTDTARFRNDLHAALRKKRKVALRLGRLSDNGHWILRPTRLKKVLSGDLPVGDLTADDVEYEVTQKGVDMRIGMDIASLVYKRLVDQIVLMTGDSDFVPAAKLARREGIDFILDPMWQSLPDDLEEHVDGVRSTCPKPKAGVPG